MIPQFLVTGLSSIIFAIFDPEKNVLPAHRGPTAPGPVNGTVPGNVVAENVTEAIRTLLTIRDDESDVSNSGGQSNSVVYIFRRVFRYFIIYELWLILILLGLEG